MVRCREWCDFKTVGDKLPGKNKGDTCGERLLRKFTGSIHLDP